MTESTTRNNRNRSVKMQLITGSENLSTPTVSVGLGSPIDDSLDDNGNKFIAYLHRLAGNHEVEADMIMKDHNYARPWNWKPESVFVRPAKKIFFSKPVNIVTKIKDDFIDVETTEEEPPVPPFDLSKVRQSMTEFQRVSNSIRSEDVDDWEEKIDKILWSPVQNRIFNRVTHILNHERIVRLTQDRSLYEPILRRTSIDLTAKKFRETLASANWDWRVTQWLHSLLFDYLPQDYLTIYLDILQSLRQKIPQLIDKMITLQPNGNSKSSAVTWETLGPLLKKSWDPVSPILSVCKPKKLSGNPILVIIPNGISNSLTSRQQKWAAQLGMLSTVVTISTNLGLNVHKMTILNSLEQLVQTARTRIQDIKVECPNRQIILIGFNTGAGIACQVGTSENVAAIVCIGFPLSTADGKRGTSDDLMLDLRCPVMFVIGEHSSQARVDDVEAMRERMLVTTSLVVVGSADDQLRIPASKKMTERLSQSIVDRCVLDEIADFVGGILAQPSPMPVRTMNTHLNNDNKGRKTNDSRKRKNSTSSCSLDSEPQSPCVKRGRPHSPAQINALKNILGIPGNSMPRTTSTQTPKPRKPRTNHQNFAEQQIVSRLASQNVDSSTGGITLNIGSLASLAPVGPIRFEPSPINLSSNKTGTIKTSAKTCIKVPKGSHQVNMAGNMGHNAGKIKMLMPTKKPTNQRASMNHKNMNIADKPVDMSVNNIPSSNNNVPVRIGGTISANVNTKILAEGTLGLAPLPSIPKNVVNSANVAGNVSGKSTASTNFSSKSATVAASATLASAAAPPKVSDGSSALGLYNSSKKRQQVQLGRGSTRSRSTTQKSRSSKTSFSSSSSSTSSSPKSSGLEKQAKQASRNVPAVQSMTAEKSTMKISTDSIDTSYQHRCKLPTATTTVTSNRQRNPKTFSTATTMTNLNDGLENILDIPIIIAKDGENLNLSSLATPSSAPSSANQEMRPSNLPPPLQVCSNNVFFFNSRIQPTLIQPASGNTSKTAKLVQPSPIKYTKIILTKRSDVEDNTASGLLTKSNGNRLANKLLLVESSTDIKYIQASSKFPDDFLGLSEANELTGKKV